MSEVIVNRKLVRYNAFNLIFLNIMIASAIALWLTLRWSSDLILLCLGYLVIALVAWISCAFGNLELKRVRKQQLVKDIKTGKKGTSKIRKYVEDMRTSSKTELTMFGFGILLIIIAAFFLISGLEAVFGLFDFTTFDWTFVSYVEILTYLAIVGVSGGIIGGMIGTETSRRANYAIK